MAVLAAAVSVVQVPPAVAADGAPLPVAGVRASADDVAANTLDRDPATRWSGQGDGVWIEYDLGAANTIGSVSIAWHKGDTRRDTFDVQLSPDASSWTTVLSRATSSGSTTAAQNHDFPDLAARYLRVVGHGNTVNDWTSITETTVHGADGGGTCRYPAEVLDLANWYVGLPIGAAEKPKNVEQPELATFAVDPWFQATADCAAVRFRAPVNGVTTTGSKYPRSELREMKGKDKASWLSTSGTHTMVIDQAITALPKQTPNVVVGQIHDASDDVSVFRLEDRKLYLTDGDSKHTLLTDDYVLGTRFEAKFEVGGGKVRAYYNGVLRATLAKRFSGAYFKAGAYTQANCGNSSPCDAGNHGEVRIHGLRVTHSG